MRQAILCLGAAVMLAACGGSDAPKAGDTCQAGTATCGSSTQALTCESGTLAASSCKGPQGCAEQSGQIYCDITGNQVGDSCPPELEGSFYCSSTDAAAVLECTGGQVVQADTCGTQCVVNNDTVSCQ